MSTSAHQLAIPTSIESPRAKLVYLSLLTTQEATVTELQRLLGLPKLTLLSILSTLVTKDLVRQTGGTYAAQ